MELPVRLAPTDQLRENRRGLTLHRPSEYCRSGGFEHLVNIQSTVDCPSRSLGALASYSTGIRTSPSVDRTDQRPSCTPEASVLPA